MPQACAVEGNRERDDAFGYRPRRGVFVPRLVNSNDKVLPNSSAGWTSDRIGEGTFRLHDPKVLDVLNPLGIVDSQNKLVSKKQPVLVCENQAQLKPLGALNLIAAQFFSPSAEEKLREDFEGEYTFVPDFELAFPSARDGSEYEDMFDSVVEDQHWREKAGIEQAHREGFRGQSVLIGVLDTGIDVGHAIFRRGSHSNRSIKFAYIPPYSPNEVREMRGFDPSGHGTHVCGILKGRELGIARDATLCVASVIESESSKTSFSRVVTGLDWILSIMGSGERPTIINLSLGFPPECPQDMTAEEYALSESTLRFTIDALSETNKNLLIVAAIGNDGGGRYRLPGAYPNVLGVGAVDYEHCVADFSGSGHGALAKPDIAGFGVDVYSGWRRTYDDRSIFRLMSGTSMASPYVAGVAALYWSRNPRMSGAEVREALLQNTAKTEDFFPVSGGEIKRAGSGLAIFR